MTTPSTARLAGAAALICALASLLWGAPASADDSGQIIDPSQAQGTGRVVLAAGHVDFGPTYGTGSWALQIHDDTTTPRYWRNPADVVLQVSDAAMLEVPDDDAFAFLQLPPGSRVHVVPQVEQPGVVWVGWNTQEPTVLDSLMRGATLRIHAIEGPGEVTSYLQGGNFGEPQVLWSTRASFPQEAWIEVNTHTHANWVFSEPGVYLVDAEFAGELTTGEELSARGTLRFAVGDDTDPGDAFAAQLPPPDPSAAASDAGAASVDDGDRDGDGEGPSLWILVTIGAVGLIVAVAVVTTTSARARRRAQEGRS